MQLRPVWCIHIAAFVFSVMVLAVSAFSYYRAIQLIWDYGNPYFLNRIYFDEGHLLVLQFSDLQFPSEFKLVKPFSTDSWIEESVFDSEHGFLSVRYLTNHKDGAPFSLTVIPLWFFLLVPMTWLCGFYLVRLRRRFRAGSSDSPRH